MKRIETTENSSILPKVVGIQLKVVQLQLEVADFICNMTTSQNSFAASKLKK